MINKYFYNTIIEMVIFISLIFWVVLGCTILIPFLWNIEGDYWNAKPFIENMRFNKF